MDDLLIVTIDLALGNQIPSIHNIPNKVDHQDRHPNIESRPVTNNLRSQLLDGDFIPD